MSNIISFLTDVLAMLGTPEGRKVVADLEAIAGLTPPATPNPPHPSPNAVPVNQPGASPVEIRR